uniref:Uncharacterized protein n=1 Tax=Oncorhynchus mykiss TaxID=8022 RepID=A0A8K9UD60_ONCMY
MLTLPKQVKSLSLIKEKTKENNTHSKEKTKENNTHKKTKENNTHSKEKTKENNTHTNLFSSICLQAERKLCYREKEDWRREEREAVLKGDLL